MPQFRVQLRQPLRELPLLIRRELADAKSLQIALDFPIRPNVDEAEHQLLGIALELPTDVADPFQQLVHGEAANGRADRRVGRTSQHQRIEAPDDALLSNPICKPFERVDSFRDRRHIRLQAFTDIVIQRELEIVLPEAKRLHLVQSLQQRPRVLRPEDNHPRLGEGHLMDCPAIGVLPRAPPFTKT